MFGEIQREAICLILKRPAELSIALHNIRPWKKVFNNTSKKASNLVGMVTEHWKCCMTHCMEFNDGSIRKFTT